MLPFPVLNYYGNDVKDLNWYNGAELLSFDSQNVNSAGFTEYTGKSMLSSSVQKAGYTDFPVQYKSAQNGFYLNNGWLRSATGTFSNTLLTSAWTLDYWYKMEQLHSTGYYFYHYPLLHSTATDNNSSRLLLAPGSGVNNNKITLWNNSSSVYTFQSTGTNAQLRNTTWTHVAFVYNGAGTTNIYINGTYLDNIVKTIAAVSGSTSIGPWGNNSTTGDKFVMERFRLRSGVVWSTSFDLSTIYPSK